MRARSSRGIRTVASGRNICDRISLERLGRSAVCQSLRAGVESDRKRRRPARIHPSSSANAAAAASAMNSQLSRLVPPMNALQCRQYSVHLRPRCGSACASIGCRAHPWHPQDQSALRRADGSVSRSTYSGWENQRTAKSSMGINARIQADMRPSAVNVLSRR